MKNLIFDIEAIIDEAATMKNSYFFTPPQGAKMRRSYEAYHSHPKIEWTENGHTYTAVYEVLCSCHNVYANGYYTRDGVKTTLTAIKNSLKRLKAAEGATA